MKLLSIIFLAAISSNLYAETRYVTDIFQITLRSGQSTKNEIIRMLPSGQALKILGRDASTGYTHVKTPEGKEGWVLSRYLMDVPSARARLSRAETKQANLDQDLNKVKAAYKQLNDDKNSLEKENRQLKQQNKKLSRNLSNITRVSSNAIQISSENLRMKKRLAETDREIQFIQQENANLQDRSQRDWFIVGALVVGISMIFGILLTKIRWKKKSSWGDI
ncbi:MAG: TIGR04211 family SH3 domain-containing protein [Gammaproteobacteria bacterium]|nr:TIGR04211 family SH3 domain-containing protein [Gammaproteobacteria bacterium]